MKKLTLILACMMLFAFGAFWDGHTKLSNLQVFTEKPPSPQSTQSPDLLTEVPDSQITPLKGPPFGLHTLQGKMVLVNFWATWCAPCAEEFPTLLAFAKDHPNVTLLAVSVDEDPRQIAPFFTKLGVDPQLERPNVIVAVDPQQQLAEQFQSFQYPETYVLTPALQLQRKLVGKVTQARLKSLLK